MDFCPECGGVLLPKENKLHCFNCGYNKKITKTQKKDYIINQDVSEKHEIIITNDKINTHPTTKGLCYRCGNRELEWWMVQMHRSDEAETRFYRCTKCGNTWRRSN